MGNNESQLEQTKASEKKRRNHQRLCSTMSATDSRETSESPKKFKPLLNSHQKSLLIKSWNHHSYRHCHGTENIGVKIYLKIFDLYPEVKKVFGFENLTCGQLPFNEKFIKQAKTFITVTDNALKNLDELETKVHSNLFALGGRHVKLRDKGFKHQYWDVFAETMLECMIESQGIHRHRDVTTVWRIFITWMIGVMKDGYFHALKNERQSTTTNAAENSPEKGNNNDPSIFNDELLASNNV